MRCTSCAGKSIKNFEIVFYGFDKYAVRPVVLCMVPQSAASCERLVIDAGKQVAEKYNLRKIKKTSSLLLDAASLHCMRSGDKL